MRAEEFAVFNEFADGSRQYIRRAADVEQAVEAFSDTVVEMTATRVVVSNGKTSLVWTLGGGLQKE